MAKLYYDKIINGEQNISTGEIWSIADVPKLWKAEVTEMIAINEEENLDLTISQQWLYNNFMETTFQMKNQTKSI